MFNPKFSGMTRAQLERDLAAAYDNLTATQTQCTKLLEENRVLRAGIPLSGWWCPCGCFNGEGKAPRAKCRTCDGEKPT